MRPDRHRAFTLVLALVGCVVAPTTTPPMMTPPAMTPPLPPVVAAAPVAIAPPPDEAEKMCAGVEAGAEPAIRVRVEHAILECPEGRLDRCHGENRYVVANCGAEPVLLQMLAFVDTQAPRGRMIVEPADGQIAPRRSWAWKTQVFREAELTLQVVAVDMHGVPIRIAEQPVRVSNPTREAAMAACTACNGVWGIPGLSYRDACNCRTRDAGQVCHDGDACESMCLFDRWQVSTPAQRCKGRACRGRPPAVGRPVGRCADRVALRSCHRFLKIGVADEPDQPLPWGVSQVCID